MFLQRTFDQAAITRCSVNEIRGLCRLRKRLAQHVSYVSAAEPWTSPWWTIARASTYQQRCFRKEERGAYVWLFVGFRSLRTDLWGEI